MPSLDKKKERLRSENEKLEDEAKRFLAAGEFNPPFPHAIVPFNTEFFNMGAEPPNLKPVRVLP